MSHPDPQHLPKNGVDCTDFLSVQFGAKILLGVYSTTFEQVLQHFIPSGIFHATSECNEAS